MRRVIAILAVLTMVLGMAALAGAVEPDFMEDFEDGDVAGWVASTPGPWGNGTFQAVTAPSSPSGGDYVGRMDFGGSCYGWSRSFDPVTPEYISWYFRADGDTGHPSGLALALRSSIGGGGWMAFISYHQTALRLALGGWNYLEIMPASMGIWYLIELKNIDWDSDTFDIWVDGVEKVVGQPFLEDVDDVSFFYNYACPRASGPSYVDDITFAVNEPPVCDDAVASLDTLWPPNHKFIDINVLGVTDPDGDLVTITIDSIFQDEPTDSLGDGAFSPDAEGVGTDTATVRAERDGTRRAPGNGRVYHVGYTADDGNGLTCSGTVTVGVPHDVQDTPVDEGALFDSTIE